MKDEISVEDLPAVFEFLKDTPYTVLTLEPGTYVFREHEGCGRIGFVFSGTIKVFKDHPSGRSITLYRLDAGDSCILSMSCALSNPIHQASAIVEDRSVVLTVTTEDFRRLMDRSAPARDYVFGLFASRLTDVLLLLEEVVFQRMDERLAAILLENSARHTSDTVHATHEQLAEEAGTAREVVTRVLRDFVSHGYVEVGRGQVRILDRKGLSHVRR
ncbi:MAG: Crp/Fnr family transcriptional regulator [Ignavibacteriae bacterium]|nr:MAG: Crp/Fnr family transcriptional regulator [Ignavibacteriota bacterium]